jgi:hypothetical protein
MFNQLSTGKALPLKGTKPFGKSRRKWKQAIKYDTYILNN